MEIMGICNVTPDSFSDGGLYASESTGLAHGRAMVSQGASIIDVGGESTRPGATPIDAGTEWSRIAPIVTALVADGVAVSVDTYHSETARRAIDAGVTIINDVTGGRIEPEILSVVAGSSCDYVLQHSRGGSATTNETAVYGDVVSEVGDELERSLAAALDAGIDRERIILDPGLGFSKIGDHNWQILSRFDELTERFGGRWLIGHSRKRFVPEPKDTSTAVITALVAYKAWAVRVHDVAGSRASLEIVGALHG